MDPTLYNAAVEGNTSDGDFLLAEYLKRDEEIGDQVTPNGNTVLHVAALYGHSHFVGEVLEITPGLLCQQNKKNETALHIAANEGHIEVVRVLLSITGEEYYKEILMRMTDVNGDTALHKSLRNRHQDVAILLVKEDPEFEFQSNKALETPLYLAAENGLHNALSEILNSCSKKPTVVVGPLNRTPLHAAVIRRRRACVRLLWQWNKSLCEEPVVGGWNSLHYAVYQGLTDVVSDILEWKKSLAYVQAGNENYWTTTVHIAVAKGSIHSLNVLLKHCPDCWEMRNSSGQNVLHEALLEQQTNVVVNYLLKYAKWDCLIDDPESDGNTPLHLLAFPCYWSDMPFNLVEPFWTKIPFNKENQTPMDVALSFQKVSTINKKNIADNLYCNFSGYPHSGLRFIPLNTSAQRTNNLNQAKDYQMQNKRVQSVCQTHLVVATLLVTVTFAAGFTLPGGFESDDNSPNKGMAILTRIAAFRAFVIADVIAFACSAAAIFIYFIMGAYELYRPTSIEEFNMLRTLGSTAGYLQVVAMAAVVIAFVTGMYATLAHSVGLAATVCVIGCFSFIVSLCIVHRVAKKYFSRKRHNRQDHLAQLD